LGRQEIGGGFKGSSHKSNFFILEKREGLAQVLNQESPFGVWIVVGANGRFVKGIHREKKSDIGGVIPGGFGAR